MTASISLVSGKSVSQSDDAERRVNRRRSRDERLLVQVVSAVGAPELAGATLPSRTCDVSSGGLGLWLGQQLAVGVRLELWVNVSGMPGKFFLCGEVRWSRAVAPDYLHGIELVPVPGDDLARWQRCFY
jgi:hypothetical protein